MKVERRSVPRPPEITVVLTLDELEARLLRVVVGNGDYERTAIAAAVSRIAAESFMDRLYSELK
jgi:hypothetical protein